MKTSNQKQTTIDDSLSIDLVDELFGPTIHSCLDPVDSLGCRIGAGKSRHIPKHKTLSEIDGDWSEE